MKSWKSAFVAVALVFGLGGGGLFVSIAQAQDQIGFNPGLPIDNQERLPQAFLGLNTFETPGRVIPGHHSDVPRPPIDRIDLDDLLPSPDLPQIRRYYIYCYYYGCRPWFRHPFTGAILKPWQVLQSVNYNNPDWLECAKGKTLEELTQVDEQLGEPLVQIDQHLVDESSDEAKADWQDQQEAEEQNFVEVASAAELSSALKPVVRPIWHAPFYGLYCLRVRICVPILNPTNHITANGVKRWRFWCRFPFKRIQPVCWKRWWWYRWCKRTDAAGNSVWRRCAWRPWCLPYLRWTRSGPDWVAHVTSVNRWRRWCLWGFRYYFRRISADPVVARINTANLGVLPKIADLSSTLEPNKDFTTGWQRPWPYPSVRYWPFRPYCTRWFWFRCLPWWRYRHFPPVIQFSVAVPKPAFGAGFDPNPNIPADTTRLFSDDPPNIADGAAIGIGEVATQGTASFDSFFDIDVECRGRAELHPVGDQDGDGLVKRTTDRGFGIKLMETIGFNQDAEDK